MVHPDGSQNTKFLGGDIRRIRFPPQAGFQDDPLHSLFLKSKQGNCSQKIKIGQIRFPLKRMGLIQNPFCIEREIFLLDPFSFNPDPFPNIRQMRGRVDAAGFTF